MPMAENQSKHHARIEEAVIESNVKGQARGTTYGFIMGMTSLSGGMFLIYSGHGATESLHFFLALPDWRLFLLSLEKMVTESSHKNPQSWNPAETIDSAEASRRTKPDRPFPHPYL